MGEYETIDRLCEVTNHLLEIVRKQAETIAQCEISKEVETELVKMREKADSELDLLEFGLRERR